MNYPKRGQMSEDGKYYTHTDGRVCIKKDTGLLSCLYCEFRSCANCFNPASTFCGCSIFVRIEGAYVPSDEEQAACDMARNAIRLCQYHLSLARNKGGQNVCGGCSDFSNKSCPARAYLAAHGQTYAWEVKT